MPNVKYYPKSYNEARSNFRRACEQRRDEHCQIERIPIPCSTDQDLTVDAAYWPALPASSENNAARRKTLLILVSGVHGMEGACGSALQAMFLEELWPTVQRTHTGVWMVHSMNPFGFKYGRRSTERNVNLNRNFAASPQLFKSPNVNFERIADFFEPKGPVKWPEAATLATALFLGRSLTVGRFTTAELSQAIGQGQFTHARALEYGGTECEPQTDYFIRRLKELEAGYDDIVLFDIHSGLGERYQLHIIPGDMKGGSNPELLKKFFDFEKFRDLYVWTPTHTPGFYQTCGDSNSLIPQVTTRRQRVLALTLEFGTLGESKTAKIESLTRIRLENQGYHCGYASAQAEKTVRRRFRELFDPSEQEWRENVIRRTRVLWLHALEQLALN